MVKYYYDRYTTTVVYPATAASATTIDYGNSMAINQVISSSYSYSATDGYQMTGTRVNITATQPPIVGYYHAYSYQDTTYLIRMGSTGNLAPSGGYYENMGGNKVTYIKGTWARGTLQTTNNQAEYGTYPANGRHTDGYWYVQKGPVNAKPTLTISSPSNNVTLYENDTLTIEGSAIDSDANQSVTVYYQLNAEAKKVLATNLSQVSIPFNKQLTFKNGKLYDGETAVSNTLVDGVAHTLKLWAQDSEGAESTATTRTFYVVPNRAPLLTIDPVTPAGNINTDTFTIGGSVSDLDANANVKVTYRINANNSVEIYTGPGGPFNFDFSLGQLVVGQNTILIEATDNYGAKISKTIKLNKKEVNTPILRSVARYKIEPPKGSAKGVLLWIQRDENLDSLSVELSMTLQGEQEQYVSLTPTTTAPISTGVVEDEFYYETAEAKNNIILKLSTTRPSADVNHKIHLISGVLE